MAEGATGALKQLLDAQPVLGRAVTRALDNLRKLGKAKITAAVLRNRLNILNDNWGKYQTNHVQIEGLTTDETRLKLSYYVQDEYSTIEESYLEASHYISECLDRFNHPVTSESCRADDSSIIASRANVKLPRIDLPKFSGSYTDWESFRDLFDALVIKNDSLSDSQRLQYLKASLSGEPSNLLKNVSVTSANFVSTWEILQTRYENQRAIINAHLTRFFNLPTVGKDVLNDLKHLRGTVDEVMNALKNLKRPVGAWDDLTVYFIVSRLDVDSRREWETSLGDSTEYPTFDKLSKFMSTRVRTLEAISTSAYNFSGTCAENPKDRRRREIKAHLTLPASKCTVCSANHFLYQCDAFRAKSVSERVNIARNIRCCFNCLRPGHFPRECPSKNVCNRCRKKHHSLLHDDSKLASTASNHREALSTLNPESASFANNFHGPSAQIEGSTHGVASHFSAGDRPYRRGVVLATAWVRVISDSGRSAMVRALLDQGSEATFVTESVVQLLRAPRRRVSASVTGLSGSLVGDVKSVAKLTLGSCISSSPVIPVRALVLQKLTSYTPPIIHNLSQCEHLRDLPFADTFVDDCAPIQLLIGADVYGSVLRSGLKVGLPGTPIAQNTIFGWVLSGPVAIDRDSTVTHLNVLHCHSQDDLNESLRRFWEIEDLPRKTFLTDEERRCEEHFVSTHSRALDGRYIVRLPFKRDPPLELGESKVIATASFLRLERRLNRSPDLARAYRDFISEYESLGHMQSIADSELPRASDYYFPHHPVVKEGSATTKVRVVFNASSPTSTGTSLNSLLLIGPKLQTDLVTILTRWRTFRYVYSGDMEKMFRQIWVDHRDTDYQRIIWRSRPTEPLLSYRLLTVTYGTASAPYLAIRVIRQLTADEGHRFPLAVPILNNNVYVDDVLFGADDHASLRTIRDQVTALLMAGGFHLRKWMSNCPELLADISAIDRGGAHDRPLHDCEGHKVLGIIWSPADDSFHFKIDPPTTLTPTKRQVLSAIAKIFDPLGWASPVVITAKIFLQTLWRLKINWDDPLTGTILRHWKDFCLQLPFLDQLAIPRWTGQGRNLSEFEIHGFADASNLAYAAVVYLRIVENTGQVKTSLVMAKSKVAPVKSLSIPRLELCAAALLSRVITELNITLGSPMSPVYCWTDSQVVLAWLRKEPSHWKTFVANRVSDIQGRLPNALWRHVPSGQNPADCASRGISASDLGSHPLWWHGPCWLSQAAHLWPEPSEISAETVTLEQKVASHSAVLVNPTDDWEIIYTISSWPRLLRVTAYVYRFIDRVRSRECLFIDTAVTLPEVEQARWFWLRYVQSRYYKQEMNDLRSGQEISKRSNLRSLDPFLDEKGIIRVGGRLRHSLLSFEIKHPVVLPKHRISELIVEQTHLRSLHGGVQVTLRLLRQQYWILGARNMVKTHIHRCVICAKLRASMTQQLMGDLPAVRVTPSRPFSHSGVDFAGPISIKSLSGRGYKTHKAYIGIFVCLATRAIHLELVSDYSSAAFLAAFFRFSSRRGVPRVMYSDNGTNFQGADKELTNAFKTVIRDTDLRSRLASDGTAWHFTPPNAPHFGGIWEAGVKGVKHHLRRVIGTHTLTFEEMSTVLCQIECVLNSRPIAPLSDSIDNFDALTPGDFLVGTPLTAVPAPSLLDVKENRLARWQLVRQLFERFWRIWASDYLQSLQQRHKWNSREPDLRIGDLVLLRNNNLPPSKWSLGRILDCHPGHDGLVRVVTIKTAQSTFKRPITQICRLPIRQTDSNDVRCKRM